MVCKNVQNDVFRGASRVEFSHELKANAFRNSDDGESRVDQTGVFRRSNPIGEGIGCTAHTCMGVRGLNEVARPDELLSCHLMADTW